MSLESQIAALIAALNENTAAVKASTPLLTPVAGSWLDTVEIPQGEHLRGEKLPHPVDAAAPLDQAAAELVDFETLRKRFVRFAAGDAPGAKKLLAEFGIARLSAATASQYGRIMDAIPA